MDMNDTQNNHKDIYPIPQNTQFQSVEKLLKQSESFIRTVTDNIPGMVGYWTSDLRCAFANKHYLTWFGREKEQMIGIRMQDLLGKKLFEANEPFIRGALKGEVQRFERTIIKPNGQVSYTYAQYIPDIDKEEVKGFYALVLDITDLKKGQESLRESEMRYRGLLTNIEAGIVVYSPDATIKTYNDRASELLGITQLKNNGNTTILLQAICLDENGNLLDTSDYPIYEILNNRQPIKNKIIGIKNPSSKDIIWVSVNGFPFLNSQEEVLEIVVSFVDITARKNAEQILLERTEELEILNATKDKFFNIIAHDLRNPFIGIKAISELIEQKFKETKQEEDEVFFKYIQLIINSSNSALSLINNLTQWAKSQTRELIVNLEIISLNSLITKTIPIINPNAINKDINIEVNLSKHDLIKADESLLGTILRNLLTNAIKFTHSNGKIIVSSNPNGGFLEISITDTGIGIEPQNLKKVFKIDSKFTKLGTNDEKGTGLGLILCKEFVEMQGGKIWVTSEVGVGSTFTFTLPLAVSNP